MAFDADEIRTLDAHIVEPMLDGMLEGFDSLRAEIRERHAALQERIDELSSRIEDTNSRVAVIDSRTETEFARIAELLEQILGLSARNAAAAERQDDALRARTIELEFRVKELERWRTERDEES